MASGIAGGSRTGFMDEMARSIVSLAQRPVQALLIAGPTASGKSRAAVAAAAALGGVIINADSMQVYRQLRILTARPSEEDELAVPHRLFGHVDGSVSYSVGVWLDEARREFAAARDSGRPAIFVGGTGLYFEALEGGLSDLPQPDPAVRDKWRRQAARSPGELHGELARRDPEAAQRLAPGDTHRLVRALEIVESTGKAIGVLRRARRQPPMLAGVAVARVLLEPDRSQLAARISGRLAAMVRQGAVAEVEALLRQGIAADSPVMKAIGVRQFARHIEAGEPLAACIERVEAATRQYAKRQATWFRNRFDANWVRLHG